MMVYCFLNVLVAISWSQRIWAQNLLKGDRAIAAPIQISTWCRAAAAEVRAFERWDFKSHIMYVCV